MASNTARKGRKVRSSFTWGTASVKVSAWPFSCTAMVLTGASAMGAASAARAEAPVLSTVSAVAAARMRWDMRVISNYLLYIIGYPHYTTPAGPAQALCAQERALRRG